MSSDSWYNFWAIFGCSFSYKSSPNILRYFGLLGKVNFKGKLLWLVLGSFWHFFKKIGLLFIPKIGLLFIPKIGHNEPVNVVPQNPNYVIAE